MDDRAVSGMERWGVNYEQVDAVAEELALAYGRACWEHGRAVALASDAWTVRVAEEARRLALEALLARVTQVGGRRGSKDAASKAAWSRCRIDPYEEVGA